MGAWLNRCWHDPRIGPVLFVPLALVALATAVMVGLFPLVTLREVALTVTRPGHAPFADAAAWYPATMTATWPALAVGGVAAGRTARLNRGLDWTFSLRALDDGSAQPARALAEELRAALTGRRLPLDVSEVVDEDYGSGFWLRRGDDTFWLAVAFVERGQRGERTEANALLAYDPGLDLRRRLRHRADRALFEHLAGVVETVLRASDSVEVVAIERQ